MSVTRSIEQYIMVHVGGGLRRKVDWRGEAECIRMGYHPNVSSTTSTPPTFRNLLGSIALTAFLASSPSPSGPQTPITTPESLSEAWCSRPDGVKSLQE